MAQLSQNDILFANITVTDETTGEFMASTQGKISRDTENKIAAGKGKPIVNTVSIDWNNAQLQSAVQSLESNLQEGVAVSEITTSGDLLKVIAQLQAQVNTLTVLIKGLYNGLSA